MGWIPVGLAAVAAFLSRHNASGLRFWLAIGVAVVAFWSYGITHNIPYAAASRRRDTALGRMREEGVSEAEIRASGLDQVVITEQDAHLAPDWAAYINFIAAVGSLAVLVWAIVSPH